MINVRRRTRRLVVGAGVAVSSLALLGVGSAHAQTVPCPPGALNAAVSRGTLVEQYYMGRVAIAVYQVDGIFVAVGTTGNLQISGFCAQTKPARPPEATDTFQRVGGRGGGGGGGGPQGGYGGGGGYIGPSGSWGRTPIVEVGELQPV